MFLHQLVGKGEDKNIVFKCHGKSVTYLEFRNKIKQYRSFLNAQGVLPGDRVGLYLKNCPEFVYTYFAVVSMGAVIVPLNRTLTAKEIMWIAQNAQMKAIVTLQLLEVEGIAQFTIEELEQSQGRFKEVPSFEPETENEPCVIIYTSGTTGFPKGAILTHRNLVSNTVSISQALEIHLEDNFLTVLPMFHSFAWTATVLSAIFTGATVTIMEMFHPKDVLKTIVKEQITVVCGVPAMYNYYLSLGSKELYNSVRLFVSGGAALPIEMIEQFKVKLGYSIVEGYGLSEASPVVSVNPIDQTKAGSIGIPLPGVEVLIQGVDQEILPAGEIGELIVRGANVMQGYYQMPEATAKAIVNGWLRTGDLAYKDAEGYVYIVDRLKDMIIVGGFNVYPREIEEVIYQYPMIQEASVIGVQDKVRGEVACAYIVLKENAEYNKREFMRYLQENLANYKIPREIVVAESLPKNAAGKILKKELREIHNKSMA